MILSYLIWLALPEKCLSLELFRSVFSHIRTEYEEIKHNNDVIRVSIESSISIVGLEQVNAE